MRKKYIYPTRPLIDQISRFDKFVFPEPNTGCWIWGGALTAAGYGLFSTGRQNEPRALAHRFSYERVFGKIPDGKVLRHCCDNTFCVNPQHLIPGTHSDNTQDMVRRGRRVRIPFETVQEIRKVFNPDKPDYVSLSHRFSVSQIHIVNIVKFKYRKYK